MRGDVPLDTSATQTITLTIDAGYALADASGGLNPPLALDFGDCSLSTRDGFVDSSSSPRNVRSVCCPLYQRDQQPGRGPVSLAERSARRTDVRSA